MSGRGWRRFRAKKGNRVASEAKGMKAAGWSHVGDGWRGKNEGRTDAQSW